MVVTRHIFLWALVLTLRLPLGGAKKPSVPQPDLTSLPLLINEREMLNDPEAKFRGFYDGGDPAKFVYYRQAWEPDAARDEVHFRNNRHRGRILSPADLAVDHEADHEGLILIYVGVIFCTWVPYAVNVGRQWYRLRLARRRRPTMADIEALDPSNLPDMHDLDQEPEEPPRDPTKELSPVQKVIQEREAAARAQGQSKAEPPPEQGQGQRGAQPIAEPALEQGQGQTGVKPKAEPAPEQGQRGAQPKAELVPDQSQSRVKPKADPSREQGQGQSGIKRKAQLAAPAPEQGQTQPVTPGPPTFSIDREVLGPGDGDWIDLSDSDSEKPKPKPKPKEDGQRSKKLPEIVFPTPWLESENDADIDSQTDEEGDEGSMWEYWKKLRARSQPKPKAADASSYYTNRMY